MRCSLRLCGAILFVLAGAWLAPAPPAAAAPQIRAPGGGSIYALIVGIDDYAAKQPLHGAVADARDLNASLLRAGVPKENITLIDEAAKSTRSNILGQMRQLAGKAGAGDEVILAFAGHGARVKEMYPDTKPDHMDEVYVLARFDETVASGAGEVIAGPEIKHWIGLLDAKGADVLFIADTCHGGGLIRTVARDSPALSYRLSAVKYAKLEANAYSSPADAARTRGSFPHLTFLAAADPSQKAPEIKIQGQATLRGALSYAMARAIEGGAEAGQGSLTRRDLFAYVRQVVLNYSDRQVVFTRPEQADWLDKPVFRTVAGGERPPVEAVPDTGKPLMVAVINGDASVLAGVQKLSTPFGIASSAGNADIVWDAAKHEALSGGDVVARDVDAATLPGVAGRVMAARILARLSESRPQNFRLLPDNSLHRKGETLSLQAEDVAQKYLIAFNITGDGLVQYLFPLPNETAMARNSTWTIGGIEVTDHFGSDQVVLIASPTRLTGLEEAIRAMNNSRAAGAVPDVLKAHLDPGRQVRLGLAAIVTAP